MIITMNNIIINMDSITFSSVKPDKIYLPYIIDDELTYQALQAIWEGGKDIGNIKGITAYLVPHISRTFLGIGFVLSIATSDGQHTTKRIRVDAPFEQINTVLKRFFSAGALGLYEDIMDLFKEQYEDFLINLSHKRVPIMLDLLERGWSVDDVIKTAKQIV